MSELDGKPYICARESNRRDWRGTRVVRFHAVFPLRMTKRLSRPFAVRGDADRFASKHDGLGNRITGPHPDSKRQAGAIVRDQTRNALREMKVNP